MKPHIRLVLYASLLSAFFYWADSMHQLALQGDSERNVAAYYRYQLIIDLGRCENGSDCEFIDAALDAEEATKDTPHNFIEQQSLLH